MPNTSRLTVDATAETVYQLAGEAQHRRSIAAALTLVCTDGAPNKQVLKLAAEGIASRIVAAQLPFFVTPDDLTEKLAGLGIPRDAVTAVVAFLRASNSVRDACDQVHDATAGDLLISHLVGVPSLHGIKAARPTTAPAPPAPTPELKAPAHENATAEGGFPYVRPVAEWDINTQCNIQAEWDLQVAAQKGATS